MSKRAGSWHIPAIYSRPEWSQQVAVVLIRWSLQIDIINLFPCRMAVWLIAYVIWILFCVAVFIFSLISVRLSSNFLNFSFIDALISLTLSTALFSANDKRCRLTQVETCIGLACFWEDWKLWYVRCKWVFSWKRQIRFFAPIWV